MQGEDSSKEIKTETKITTSEPVRPKDPKRVEAGRRLGAISKAAKEKKARERFAREMEAEGRRPPVEVDREAALARETSDSIVPFEPRGVVVAGVVLAVGLGYVLYRKGGGVLQPPLTSPTDDQSSDTSPSSPSQPQRKRRSTDQTHPTSRFDSFGDDE